MLTLRSKLQSTRMPKALHRPLSMGFMVHLDSLASRRLLSITINRTLPCRYSFKAIQRCTEAAAVHSVPSRLQRPPLSAAAPAPSNLQSRQPPLPASCRQCLSHHLHHSKGQVVSSNSNSCSFSCSRADDTLFSNGRSEAIQNPPGTPSQDASAVHHPIAHSRDLCNGNSSGPQIGRTRASVLSAVTGTVETDCLLLDTNARPCSPVPSKSLRSHRPHPLPWAAKVLFNGMRVSTEGSGVRVPAVVPAVKSLLPELVRSPWLRPVLIRVRYLLPLNLGTIPPGVTLRTTIEQQ